MHWHQLDNIGAITSFCIWGIYLMDIQDPRLWCYCNFLALGLVTIVQIHAPWDLTYTIGPIATVFGCLFCRLACFPALRPTYDWTIFRRGLFLLVTLLSLYLVLPCHVFIVWLCRYAGCYASLELLMMQTTLSVSSMGAGISSLAAPPTSIGRFVASL
jgi:hypothetical protein